MQGLRRGAGALRGGALATGVFAVLSGGRAEALWVGMPAIFLAVWAGRRLVPTSGVRARLRVLPGLVLRTLGVAVLGGVDVGRRVLDPRLPISPALVLHRWGVGGPGRLTVVALVNLTPGSVAVRSRAEVLWLHVLDGETGGDPAAGWETPVRRLFPPDGGGGVA